MYVHIKRDHLVEMELSPGGQSAEKYLSNEPRMEGVGKNVAEREQFEVMDCKIVKLRKMPLKFCDRKRDKNCSKMFMWAFGCCKAQ